MRKLAMIAGALAFVGCAASGAQAQQDSAPGPITGAISGFVQGVSNIFTPEERPQFREYVVTSGVPVQTYNGDVIVGTVVPADQVTYYEMPSRYSHVRYKYAYVNNRVLIVDPQTYAVVDVIQ